MSAPRVSDLLLRWEALRQRGQAVSAEEMCADCPELLPELRRLQAVREMEAMVADSDADTPVPADNELGPAVSEGLAPPQESGEIGRLGPYRVLQVLGQGGMGVVYRGEDPQLQRHVALKVMRPLVAASPASRQRFLREARAAAALHHDHVVPIYHVGEERGVPFLVMPLLRGESLEQRLERQGKLPAAEVMRVGREAAEGLAAAHERGLVHRDIKPANLWLEAGDGAPEGPFPGGRVKVLDFGLARAASSTARVTQEGVVVGTPAYMAPEQAHDQAVDGRADLFSLGAVLYHLLTGRPPFGGENTLAVLRAVAEDQPPPPRELDPAVPAALSDLVMRLLAKRPDDRPGSAREVVKALRAIEGAPTATPAAGASGTVTQGCNPSSATRAFRPRRGRRWAAVAGMLGALAAAVVVVVLSRPSPPVHEGPPKLKGDLDVLVTEPGNPARQGLRLHQEKALPLKAGDRLRVEAKLNRPAYLYLVWLDSQGKATPQYPWRDNNWHNRPAEEHQRDHLILEDESGLGNGPSGIECLVLLVRETPLPAAVDVAGLFGGLPRQRGTPRLRAAAWFENGELASDSPQRAAMQVVRVKQEEDPVVQTQALLRGKLGTVFDYTRAVCFSFQGE
jgi:serine/threonine protein kinase